MRNDQEICVRCLRKKKKEIKRYKIEKCLIPLGSFQPIDIDRKKVF